jgi:hypothetical protein
MSRFGGLCGIAIGSYCELLPKSDIMFRDWERVNIQLQVQRRTGISTDFSRNKMPPLSLSERGKILQ